MIQSLQKIEHVQDDGTTTLLLDFGDFIEEEIEFGAEQQTTGFAPIGAMWGIGTPDGGATRTFSYSVRRQHNSHSAARSWCLSHPSLIPFNKDGILRISIRDAPDSDVEIWEIQSAVIQGCSARPLFDLKQRFRSLTTYQITGGQAVPIQGNFGQCYPIGWQTYVIGTDESIIGDDICDSFPPYVPPAPTPGDPGELEPEAGVIPGFTVSGVVSPSSLNGHYSPNGFESGNQRWKGPGDSVVVKVGVGASWDMNESTGSEPSFYTTDSPEFPWDGTWANNIGTGTVVVTVDP
jgi:hypothetical protein